jgi:hypothetical protein
MIKYSLILFLIGLVTSELPVPRKPLFMLYESDECKNDIKQFCDHNDNNNYNRNSQLSDLAILQCFHNQVKDLNGLDLKCQNVRICFVLMLSAKSSFFFCVLKLIYEVKRNVTKNLQLDLNAAKICDEDLNTVDSF